MVPGLQDAALPLVARLHVVVRVGEERFAFPVADVEEALDAPSVSWAPGATDGVVGQLLCRERNVSAYDAGWVLGVARDGRTSGALVLRQGPACVALLVDDVEDLTMVEPQWIRRVPVSADIDAVLSGVYRAPRRQGGLVGIVRVAGLVAHAVRRGGGTAAGPS
ncbi:MAG TPA: chemotaxis protein CheW [Gemmatimonadaceae bacterium]|nr:chemotaxis protein CheW [Gemmatimonadaceae bacterium]